MGLAAVASSRVPLVVTPERLRAFWDIAAKPLPIVVFGGGRWGKTWLSVISAATGRPDLLTLVARSRAREARIALSADPALVGIRVVEESAGASIQAQLAIIASRPSDHVRDAEAAIALRLHMLVEKPMGDNTAATSRIIRAAQRASVRLAIGTEFSYLPMLHACAGETSRPAQAELTWHDAVGEVRHGGTPVHHSEVRTVADVASHALSIFRALAGGPVDISATGHHGDADRGALTLSNAQGSTMQMNFDIAAARRARHLRVVTVNSCVEIDFAGHTKLVQADGVLMDRVAAIGNLTSTLRLQLGAFIHAVESGEDVPGTLLPKEYASIRQSLEGHVSLPP